MDWTIAHEAFIAYAEQVLPDAPPPVRVLGIDETRREKGRYEVVTSTGVKVWVDRFDTGLVELDGTGGLFAQVNGRTSDAVIAWLEAQDPAWRAAITQDQQRPHRGLQQNRQARRKDRVRVQEHRKPETPDTRVLRLHPRITAGANQLPE